MQPLIHKIVRTIRDGHLVAPGDTVITAISGGADSTALLHLLAHCGLGLRLTAVYIDHGLRPQETAAEHHFTRALAASVGAGYLARSLDVRTFQRDQGCSLEEAARILRYQALEEVRSDLHAQAIAVAHTADDQVEEFFIRLLRGSGLKGLSTMQPKQGYILRPLLAETKETLLDYLAGHSLQFCHDSSNDDRRFLRNRIRLDLLPDLESSYNPAIRTTVLQTADILTAENDLLEKMAADLFTDVCSISPATTPDPPIEISCRRQALAGAHPALQRRVLESVCWQMGSRPTYRQILLLQHQLASGIAGARLHLPNGLRVLTAAEALVFSHPLGRKAVRGDTVQGAPAAQLIESCGNYHFPEIGRQLTITSADLSESSVLPPYILAVDRELVDFPLEVRPPQPGEMVCLLGAPGRKKVGRIFTDLKIPAQERHAYPLLVAGDRVVAILGLRIAHDYRLTEKSTRALLLNWQPIDSNRGGR